MFVVFASRTDLRLEPEAGQNERSTQPNADQHICWNVRTLCKFECEWTINKTGNAHIDDTNIVRHMEKKKNRLVSQKELICVSTGTVKIVHTIPTNFFMNCGQKFIGINK